MPHEGSEAVRIGQDKSKDKTVGQSCLVLSVLALQCEYSWRQDETVLSCPCRRCEQAIKISCGTGQ